MAHTTAEYAEPQGTVLALGMDPSGTPFQSPASARSRFPSRAKVCHLEAGEQLFQISKGNCGDNVLSPGPARRTDPRRRRRVRGHRATWLR
jgi:hypothetical protein